MKHRKGKKHAKKLSRKQVSQIIKSASRSMTAAIHKAMRK